MELKQIILNCRNYQPNEEIISVIFAKRINGQFQPASDAVLLEVEKEDWAIKITQIASTPQRYGESLDDGSIMANDWRF